MKLLGNFFFLAAAEILGKVLTFAAYAYLARALGAENFGAIEWASAALLCAGLIVDQGFGFYGAREIAKSPERAGALIAEIIGARFVLAFAAFGVVATLALGLPQAEHTRSLLLLYGLSLFAAPLALTWVFQGFDDMRAAAFVQLVRQAVFALTVLAFVRSGAQIRLVAVAEILAACAAAACGVLMIKKRFALPIGIDFRFSAKLFREGVPIGLSQMFWTVKMFGATFIFGFVAAAEETGHFAAAMRIFIALHALVWLYYFNLLPAMVRAWHEGRDKFARLNGGSMRIVVLLGLACGIVWVLAAPLAMQTIYGREFLHGAGALQWLAGACVAAAISGHYRFGLIAAGFQKMEMLTSALGAISAAVLIPIGYYKAGASGAGAALCATELLVLLAARLIARKRLFTEIYSAESRFETLPGAASR